MATLEFLKIGLQDTVLDSGRFGFGHLGIRPSGPMDPWAYRLANRLLKQPDHSPVLEMHFPAAQLRCTTPVYIVLTGADFAAQIDGVSIPLYTVVLFQPGAILTFTQPISGARVYLGVKGSWNIPSYLNSVCYDVALASAGIPLFIPTKGSVLDITPSTTSIPYPPTLEIPDVYSSSVIRYLPESNGLIEHYNRRFTLAASSNRMGYRLLGDPIPFPKESYFSRGVQMGSIQLLPSGAIIILMADHGTTGGYPIIGHIISADLPALAQKMPHSTLTLVPCTLDTAYRAFMESEKRLHF